jgi:Ser/Thr protein kinase RdoA (MazF antagonist)
MTAIFPATYSTLSPSALADLLSEKYNLESVQCSLLARGVGDTYSVAAQGHRSVLRIYRSSHRNLPQVEAEMELLTVLRDAGVSVSYPIPDLSGKVIQHLEAVEGERLAVLFTYAVGSPEMAPNEGQLRELGHQMARFHTVSAKLNGKDRRPPIDLETTLFRPLEILRPYFAEIPEDYAWLQQAALQVREKLAQTDTSGWGTGYCHYDFLPKNFHFEGDSVTLFDFDFMGYGWLVNDVMTFWQHYCLEVYLGRTTQEAADQAYDIFLAAYAEYRTLSPRELAAVPCLGLGFWLFYIGFHTTHDQFYAYLQPSTLHLRTRYLRHMMATYAGIH